MPWCWWRRSSWTPPVSHPYHTTLDWKSFLLRSGQHPAWIDTGKPSSSNLSTRSLTAKWANRFRKKSSSIAALQTFGISCHPHSHQPHSVYFKTAVGANFWVASRFLRYKLLLRQVQWQCKDRLLRRSLPLPPVKHSTSQSSTMARSDKEAEMSQKSLLKFVPFSILETQSLQTNVLHCNEARIAYRKNEHNEDGACQMAARCIHHREDCEMIWFSEYITVDLLPPTLVTSVQQPRRHCTSIYIIQYYIYIIYILHIPINAPTSSSGLFKSFGQENLCKWPTPSRFSSSSASLAE